MTTNKSFGLMSEQYYTVKEVAEHFKVSRQSVYDWISEGRLRAVKVGNRTRIPESALDEFVRPVEPGEPLEADSEES
jgi:excisionase family DNA binding protein